MTSKTTKTNGHDSISKEDFLIGASKVVQEILDSAEHNGPIASLLFIKGVVHTVAETFPGTEVPFAKDVSKRFSALALTIASKEVGVSEATMLDMLDAESRLPNTADGNN